MFDFLNTSFFTSHKTVEHLIETKRLEQFFAQTHYFRAGYYMDFKIPGLHPRKKTAMINISTVVTACSTRVKKQVVVCFAARAGLCYSIFDRTRGKSLIKIHDVVLSSHK